MSDEDKIYFYSYYSTPGAENHSYYCNRKEVEKYIRDVTDKGRDAAINDLYFYEYYSSVDYFGHENEGTSSTKAKDLIEHVWRCHTNKSTKGKKVAFVTPNKVIKIEIRKSKNEVFGGTINLGLLAELGFPEYAQNIVDTYAPHMVEKFLSSFV